MSEKKKDSFATIVAKVGVIGFVGGACSMAGVMAVAWIVGRLNEQK